MQHSKVLKSLREDTSNSVTVYVVIYLLFSSGPNETSVARGRVGSVSENASLNPRGAFPFLYEEELYSVFMNSWPKSLNSSLYFHFWSLGSTTVLSEFSDALEEQQNMCLKTLHLQYWCLKQIKN